MVFYAYKPTTQETEERVLELEEDLIRPLVLKHRALTSKVLTAYSGAKFDFPVDW